jgi:hypothetical protein
MRTEGLVALAPGPLEDDGLLRETIDVGSRVAGITVGTKVVRAERVDADQNDVEGIVRGREIQGQRDREGEQNQAPENRSGSAHLSFIRERRAIDRNTAGIHVESGSSRPAHQGISRCSNITEKRTFLLLQHDREGVEVIGDLDVPDSLSLEEFGDLVRIVKNDRVFLRVKEPEELSDD